MKDKLAKTCYNHIGGKLGSLLYEMFVAKKWIAKKHADDKYYYITAKGKTEFEKLGLDIDQIQDDTV